LSVFRNVLIRWRCAAAGGYKVRHRFTNWKRIGLWPFHVTDWLDMGGAAKLVLFLVLSGFIAMSEQKWRPLPARDRRVAGVLVEKAKTVPDVYPMSVSALVSGCNQKNNRYPLMELEASDVEESLERLKQIGAVVEVQGSSRVPRFKHLLYEWLGVDKVELAVMAELLLRGAQTEGELRGRAARMEPIADLAALRPILDSLGQKGLIVSLTSEGRGHVLTHALYEERELEKLRADYHSQSPREYKASDDATSHPTHNVSPARGTAELAELRAEVAELREQLGKLREEFNGLAASLRQMIASGR
jgi:uncharacterized protein YceH (UPF0502 family)